VEEASIDGVGKCLEIVQILKARGEEQHLDSITRVYAAVVSFFLYKDCLLFLFLQEASRFHCVRVGYTGLFFCFVEDEVFFGGEVFFP